MTKQELIENVKGLTILSKQILNVKLLDQYDVIKLIEQLDEPQKPVVPQFVADWYEENKDEFEYNLWDWISSKDEPEKIHSEFAFWVNDVDNNPIQTLVNMHQFGYEVEKEKRYLVKMKNIDSDSAYLKHQLKNNHWYWGTLTECDAFSPYHTKKELEDAGLGRVFNSPLFEVKEVEG